MRYGTVTLPIFFAASLLTGQVDPKSDRFAEYVAVQQHIPHEKTKIWPVGDKIGLSLLVKPGVTNKQLAELVGWYISVNASVIFVYDDRKNAEKGERMVADYMDGKLTRNIYTWHRNGDLKDWKMVDIPLTPDAGASK